jgi:hypothetical protein
MMLCCYNVQCYESSTSLTNESFSIHCDLITMYRLPLWWKARSDVATPLYSAAMNRGFNVQRANVQGWSASVQYLAYNCDSTESPAQTPSPATLFSARSSALITLPAGMF